MLFTSYRKRYVICPTVPRNFGLVICLEMGRPRHLTQVFCDGWWSIACAVFHLLAHSIFCILIDSFMKNFFQSIKSRLGPFATFIFRAYFVLFRVDFLRFLLALYFEATKFTKHTNGHELCGLAGNPRLDECPAYAGGLPSLKLSFSPLLACGLLQKSAIQAPTSKNPPDTSGGSDH